MASPQESSVGVEIVMTVVDSAGDPIDVSGASVKKFVFRKPDRVIVEKDAEYFTDGTDGKLKYVTLADDLEPDGVWRVQAYVVKAGTMNGRTTVGLFDVKANIE